MSQKVRLYPTGKAFIDGVPAVVTDCTPAEAERLLAHQPPAFTVNPPQEDGKKKPSKSEE